MLLSCWISSAERWMACWTAASFSNLRLSSSSRRLVAVLLSCWTSSAERWIACWTAASFSNLRLSSSSRRLVVVLLSCWISSAERWTAFCTAASFSYRWASSSSRRISVVSRRWRTSAWASRSSSGSSRLFCSWVSISRPLFLFSAVILRSVGVHIPSFVCFQPGWSAV